MLADLSGATSSGRVKRESAGYGSLLGEPPIEVPGLPAGDISRQQLGIDNPAGMTGEMSPLSIGGMLKLAGKGLLSGGKTVLGALGDGGGLLAHTLFHGTPHKFDRFALDAIGTGEGAQAYGHGLYFAENPGVARSYQTTLSQGRVTRNIGGGLELPDEAWEEIAPIMQKNDIPGDIGPNQDQPGMIRQILDDFGDKLSDSETSTLEKWASPEGHLYEVEIPDEITDRMLDWDVPLSEQPEGVREVIRNNTFYDEGPVSGERLLQDKNLTGRHIYDLIVHPEDGAGFGFKSKAPIASAKWNEAGIPGIRYFDGDSRTAGEGTRNIVAFNPDDITSVKRDSELVWENRSGIKPAGLLDRATDTQKAKWASQAATAERIAGKRNKKTGQYAGAPKTVTSPQKRTALVNQYVRRVEDAIENNVDPGYFYEEGEQAIREFSDPGQAMRNANLVGLTSSQVGPRDNMMYFARGLEQRNMIGPEGVSTMLYPNKERPNFNTLYEGGDHWLGHKRDRYANLLTPEEARPFDLPEGSLLAPNDRWEGRAAGFKGPPSGELQVSWNDEIRDRAMEKINARRAERGERPLKAKEVQELHWAQIRAEDEGRAPTIRPEDTIGGSTDRLMYQHAWESMPGSRSGHLPEIGGGKPQGMEAYGQADPIDYHTRMRGLFEDPEGKDRLVRAMGSEVQRPMYSHLGEFEGQFAPGTTSQSLISQTDSAGLLPQSQARVRATEGVRGFMLGQDATAGRVFSPLSNPDQKFNAARYETPMMDEGTFRAIKAATHARLGDDAVVVSGQGGVDIFLPGGADKKARDALEDLDDEIFNITGSHGLKGNMQGHYDELRWKEPTGDPLDMQYYDAAGSPIQGPEPPTATEDMLGFLDDPAAPRLAEHADSPAMRELAGEFAAEYQALQGAGMSPNQDLMRVLQTWKDEGLEGVRRLVEQGLAPALVLGVLGAGASQLPSGETAEPSLL